MMNCSIRDSSCRQSTNDKGNMSTALPGTDKMLCATSATVGDRCSPDWQTSLSKIKFDGQGHQRQEASTNNHSLIQVSNAPLSKV